MSVATKAHRLVSYAECEQRWDSYVASHATGSVFHTSDIVRVFEATPGYEPFAMAALNDDDEIVALIVAARITTVSGLASSFSSRSIFYAEPICNPTPEGYLALQQLMQRHDRQNSSRTLFAEIRPLHHHGENREVLESSGYVYKDYLNYIVDTTPDVDTLWSKLSKSCRKKINRSINRGVTVEVDNSHDGIDVTYDLVSESYRRSKVPLADKNLFHAALEQFPEGVVQNRIARFEDRPVAGGIGLVNGDRFFAWYGGSVRVSSLAPFDFLTWDEIRWSSEQGLKYYDFGGAGPPDEEYGPRDFKAKFGGDLVSYGRYRRVFSAAKLAIAEKGYQLLRCLVAMAAKK